MASDETHAPSEPENRTVAINLAPVVTLPPVWAHSPRSPLRLASRRWPDEPLCVTAWTDLRETVPSGTPACSKINWRRRRDNARKTRNQRHQRYFWTFSDDFASKPRVVCLQLDNPTLAAPHPALPGEVWPQEFDGILSRTAGNLCVWPSRQRPRCPRPRNLRFHSWSHPSGQYEKQAIERHSLHIP